MYLNKTHHKTKSSSCDASSFHKTKYLNKKHHNIASKDLGELQYIVACVAVICSVCCSDLQCVLQFVAVCCSVLWCVVVCCSVLQRDAVCTDTYLSSQFGMTKHYNIASKDLRELHRRPLHAEMRGVLQCAVAVCCCSVSQCDVAVCCSGLLWCVVRRNARCVAVCMWLQYVVAVCCSILLQCAPTPPPCRNARCVAVCCS